MSIPAKCKMCKKDAVVMCNGQDCLQFFCNTCPVCPTGPCYDSDHQRMCWDSHLPPWWAGGVEAHRQCSLEDQKFVSEILYCESDPERQQTLHQEDRKALWFIAEPGEEAVDTDFGAPGTIGRDGILHVTNRLNSILMKETPPGEARQLRFPTLVSFIGETGAGKSTLIRALIKESSGEMRNQHLQFETPVVQTSSTQCLAHPTSSGVHLYKDPETFASSNPILFADCEGFNAGGTSAASFPQDLATDTNIVAKFPVTASPYTTPAEIEDLYAKSLYTFSDTICFVVKSAQTVANSMERLLLWAVKGSGTSVHMLPQKSLILILNAPRLKHNEDIMDEKALRAIFLDTQMMFWENDPVLRGISKTAFRDTPVTAEKFLHLYFSTINVLYIPDGSHPGVVHPGDIRLQLRKLHTQIRNDVRDIMSIRHSRWTQYNEWDFARLFYLALKHFATTTDVFDFSEASKSSSLDHRGLEDHILAMRRQFTSATAESCRARFPPIVASALVSKVLREGAINFNRDLQWRKCDKSCRGAIDRFYKQFRTCQFEESGKQCILNLNLHGPSHRAKGGEIIKDGGFEPGLEAIENLISSETKEIADQFNVQYLELFQDQKTIERYPAPAQVVQHRKGVLHRMYHSDYPFYSYRTCFACLNAIPDHVLPCGHAFCEACVMDFGKPMDEQAGAFIFEKCVFDGEEWTGEDIQIVQTKPEFAGVRVLTLDGGGVRGILELAMLSLLEDMIGLDMHISAFFDLIAGTSTGGLIAIGLGVENMNLLDMKEIFTHLAIATFTAIRGGITLSLGLLLTGAAAVVELPAAVMIGGILLLTGWGADVLYNQSLYRTHPLKDGMQKLLGTNTSMFGDAIRKHRQRSTRVAVMCMKEAVRVTAITNYNRPLNDGDIISQEPGLLGVVSSDFERAENEEDELKAWEAALSTSASPPYLKPFTKESSKTTYINGGLERNNPICWAAEEYRRIWDRPESEAKLDVLISLGSGAFTTATNLQETIGQLSLDLQPVVTPIIPSIYNLQGEKTWSDFMQRQTQHSATSHRLNVVIKGIRCKPDGHEAMNNILLEFNKAIVHQDQYHILDRTSIQATQALRDKVNLVAHLLVAKLFFFEPTGPLTLVKDTYTNGRDLYQVQGKILCRLRQGSDPLRNLMERIVAFSAAESESETDLHQIPASEARGFSSIDIEPIKEAVRDGKKFEVNHTITTSSPDERFQAIYVQLRHEAVIPQLEINSEGGLSEAITLDCISTRLAISGFPCSFYDLSKRPLTGDFGGEFDML